MCRCTLVSEIIAIADYISINPVLCFYLLQLHLQLLGRHASSFSAVHGVKGKCLPIVHLIYQLNYDFLRKPPADRCRAGFMKYSIQITVYSALALLGF